MKEVSTNVTKRAAKVSLQLFFSFRDALLSGFHFQQSLVGLCTATQCVLWRYGVLATSKNTKIGKVRYECSRYLELP